jgi:hypothetical protein
LHQTLLGGSAFYATEENSPEAIKEESCIGSQNSSVSTLVCES